MLRYSWQTAGVLLICVVVVAGQYILGGTTVMEADEPISVPEIVGIDIRNDSGEPLTSILHGIEPIREFAELLRVDNLSVYRSCEQEPQGLVASLTSFFSTTVHAQTCAGNYMEEEILWCGGTGSCNDVYFWHYSNPGPTNECDGYQFFGYACGECMQEEEWICPSCL